MGLDDEWPVSMDPGWLVVAVPLAAAAILALVRDWRAAASLNIAASLTAFALAGGLAWRGRLAGSSLLADGLALHMALLTTLVGAATSVVSFGFVQGEMTAADGPPRLGGWRLRLYHAMYQALLGFMLLALLADNFGVTWVAVEAATIAGVLVVSVPGTAEAVEASWKYFIVCGVGIALAFFGTVVLYLALQPVAGDGLAAMRWQALAALAPRASGPVLNLAFVFLLIGYATKAALAPLHGWMPDAHAEGPTPVSAVLAGSMTNVALTVILRLHGALAANPQALPPGPPLMALGLLSVLLAAFGLWRRRDAKRFFAVSSIEQGGVAAYAFGLGGPAAVFAGLLHLTLHTLVKAAVFFCVGFAAQRRGGQRFADLGGLIGSDRAVGLVLAAGIVAIAGLPPFGLFTSELLVLTRTAAAAPLLLLPLGLGLVVGAWACLSRLQTLCLGPSPPVSAAAGWRGLTVLPASFLLLLAAGLGLAMPAPVAAWLSAIAALHP